jgi:hypothetical protein
MVYAWKTCRAGSPRRFSDGPLPVFSRVEEAYAVGQISLNRAEYFDILWVGSTTVRIDHRLRNLPDLDMAVLRKTHHQRPGAIGTYREPLGEQAGRNSDLLSPSEGISELRDLGFQLGHSGTGVWAPGNHASLCVRWLRDHASPR